MYHREECHRRMTKEDLVEHLCDAEELRRWAKLRAPRPAGFENRLASAARPLAESGTRFQRGERDDAIRLGLMSLHHLDYSRKDKDDDMRPPRGAGATAPRRRRDRSAASTRPLRGVDATT